MKGSSGEAGMGRERSRAMVQTPQSSMAGAQEPVSSVPVSQVGEREPDQCVSVLAEQWKSGKASLCS